MPSKYIPIPRELHKRAGVKRKVLSQEQKLEAVDMKKNGVKIKYMCQKLNISYYRLSKYLKEAFNNPCNIPSESV